jgi:predicted RNA-binding protein YlxR (DUF448 family)
VTRTRKPPLRTCIGCGLNADKRELLRVVRSSEGDVTVDPSGKANGRGAYLCRSAECFDAAARRRRMDAALRVSLKEDDLDRLRREFDEAVGTTDASQQGE